MRKGWFRAQSYKMSESENNKLSREEQSRIVEKIHVSFALVLTLLRNSVELFAERVENRASCAMVTWTILNQRVEGIDEMWVEGYRKCLYFASVSSVLCLNTVQQNSTKGNHMISRYPIVILLGTRVKSLHRVLSRCGWASALRKGILGSIIV